MPPSLFATPLLLILSRGRRTPGSLIPQSLRAPHRRLVTVSKQTACAHTYISSLQSSTYLSTYERYIHTSRNCPRWRNQTDIAVCLVCGPHSESPAYQPQSVRTYSIPISPSRCAPTRYFEVSGSALLVCLCVCCSDF